MNGQPRGALTRGAQRAMMPEEYARFAWQWFRENQDRVVFRVWGIGITVKRARPLFEMLFGPEV